MENLTVQNLAEILKNIISNRHVFCASVGCYNKKQSNDAFIEVTLFSDVLYKYTYDYIMSCIPEKNVTDCVMQLVENRMRICINLKSTDFSK